MITQGGRFEMFQRAVADFRAQTYPNLELVVVSSDRVSKLRGYGSLLDPIDNAFWHALPQKVHHQLPLGVMRNYANRMAKGEYCCTWDDDDRHHPDRVQVHYDLLGAHVGTYLTEQLYYFVDDKTVCPVSWWPGRCPGILLHKKVGELYPTEGAQSLRGEDGVFLKRLQEQGTVTGIFERPELYLRQIHGRNTWSRTHHWRVALRKAMPLDRIRARREQIEAALKHFRIKGPIAVRSKHVVAFTYE